MPTYTIDAPNGKRYSIEGPPGATRDEVIAEIMRRDPSAGTPPSKARTWGESVKDVGAGLVSGVGSLAALPGQLYGLATGDMDNVSTRAGRELKESAESMKSAGLKAREAERRRKIDEAETKGQVAAGVTAIKETITDPGLLLNFVAEQLPNLLPGLAAAKGVSLATKGAASLGTKTAAAVGAGATQQGADVGAGAYDRLVQELVAKGASKEEAAQGAINLARATGASAAVISVLANKYLPGGTALERVLAGSTTGKGLVAGAAAGAIKEIPSEVTEEIGGQLAANLAMRQIKPEQALTEGLGETAGMATVGAIGLGGVTGAAGGRGAPQRAAVEEESEIDRAERARREAMVTQQEQRAVERQDVAEADRAELSRMLAGISKTDPRRKAIAARIQELDTAAVEAQRAARERADAEAAMAARSAFADPQAQMVLREAAVEGDTALPTPEPEAGAPLTAKEARAAGQQPLPFDVPEPKLRRKGEGQQLPPEPPAPAPVPAPTGDADPNKPLAREDLRGLVPERGQAAKWFEANVVGKTLAEVADMVVAKPGMVKGNTAIAKALRELTAVSSAPYEAPITDLRSEPAADGQPAESGVGAPAPAGAGPAETSTDTEGAVAPDGAGVGDVPAAAGAEPVVARPPAAPLDPIEAVETAKSDEEYQQALEQLARAFQTPSEDTRIADYVEAQFVEAPGFKRDFQAAEARLRASRRMRPETGGTSVVTVPGLDQAAQAGDTAQALKLIEQSPQATPVQRAVAQRLQRYRSLPKMKADPSLPSAGAYDARTDTVELREITPHTVLHEITHAGVHRMVAAADAGLLQSPGVRKLRAVYEHVNRVRPDLRGTYGMSSISEFASEAMSNPDFQAELRSIPYQRTNAFTAFARAIAQMFGFAGTTENTAAAEAIIAVDQILLEGGREFQESRTGQPTLEGQILDADREPVGNQTVVKLIDQITQTSEIGKDKPTGFAQVLNTGLNVFNTTNGISAVDRLRYYLTDNMAAFSSRMAQAFNGRMISAMGVQNPDLLNRQVQDVGKMLESFYEEGAFRFDATTGLFEVAKGPASVLDALKALDAYAKARGVSLDAARADISKMAEAKRALEMLAVGIDADQLAPLSIEAERQGVPKLQQFQDKAAQLDADSDAQAILELLKTNREATIDFMRDMGRITAEEAAEWKSTAHYIPFDRVRDDSATAFRPSSDGRRGLSKFRNRPEYVGTTSREVGDLLDNHMKLTTWMATEAMKAKATRHSMYVLQSLGGAKKIKLRDGKAPSGVDPMTVVEAYEKGEKIAFSTADPLYAAAFREAGNILPGWMRPLHSVTKFLRSAITLMPPFIIKQVVLDVQRALISSGVQNPYALPYRIMTNFVKLSWADLTGRKHPMAQRLARRGIAGGYDIDLEDPAGAFLKEVGITKRGAFESAVRKSEGILRASDLAVRAAIYEQTLKESNNNEILAQRRSREFINFRRKGASGVASFFISTVPFVNAYIQSMDLLYRNATGRDNSMGIPRNEARARLMTQLGVMTAFSMLYALSVEDDEEYQQMDLTKRNNNWVIPGVATIPVPPEWAAVFKVPAELYLEMVRTEGTPDELVAKDAAKAMAQALLEAYRPGTLVPAAIKPVLEAWTNYSFFTGERLVGTYQEQLDPSEQTTYRTSEMAKTLAGFMRDSLNYEVSPIKIDNFFTGYFGGTAAPVLAMTDALLNPDRMDRPLHQMFLIGTFVPDPVGTRSEREFYSFAEEIMPKVRTLQALQATDPERAEAYAEKHGAAIDTARKVGAAIQKLGQFRAREKFLRSDAAAESMTQEDREAELTELRQARNEYLSFVRELKRDYYATKSATP